MKNKKTITYLILLGLTITPSLISAEEAGVKVETDLKTDTNTTRPQPPRSEIRNMREDTRVDIKEVRQENKEQREILQKERRDQVVNLRQNASSTTQRPTAELRVLREQNKTEIRKIRTDFQENIKLNKASTTEAIKEKRESLIYGIQEKRELFKEELEGRKEFRASTTAIMKAKFKEELMKIKDENKKIRVENIADNITELNTKISNRSIEKINKLEEILITIESRADKATANNINLVNIRALISTAESAIADARLAITTQAGKAYTVSITNEATIKTSLQTTRDLLKKDIDIMNIKIKVAHEAVRKTSKALKATPKVNDEVIASSTVTTTTTKN
jgi:hypothetical protein